MRRPDPAAVLRRHLRSGAHLTPAEVAALLGVGERQARRVVRELEAADPPLRTRRDGRTVAYHYDAGDLSLLADA
ncbi:MAG TPA: hypothetical protein VGB53_15530, partial [Rubricoccaceae bacterium]